jgi:hypothetical protein
MKLIRGALIATLLAGALPASGIESNIFALKAIDLTNGWKVTGTITTDGTVGPLAAANIVDWSLKVVQTTDMVWTEANSAPLNVTGVSADGKRILVATSPDGVLDGGALSFARGGGMGTIPTAAVIADFTQSAVDLGYGFGGMVGWQDEIWGLNYAPLNRKNNSRYPAASATIGTPNTFKIHAPALATSPLLMTMFGTITTDGTIGTLDALNIVAWNITARSKEITVYTPATSAPLSVIGVWSDGIRIHVNRDGQFTIGIAGRRPTFVTIADFTDPTYPDGFANYYLGNFGVMGEKFPVVGPRANAATVAKLQ